MPPACPSAAHSGASNCGFEDDLRTQSVADALKTGIGTDGMFAVEDGTGLKSSTGALMFRPLTKFGYIARGIGQYKDEVLIATRGTDIPADWVTDLNIGMQIGPSKLLVHAGFNETWKAFLTELRSFFRTHHPTRIHCVGHSPGGALAALNADYCSDQGIAKVALYTFGAPPAGDAVFARSLTQRLGNDSIRRVSHPADPVPMIPLFPFWHLPFAKPGLTIAKTSNWPIWFNAHRMQASYVPGVTEVDWKGLGHGEARADDAAQVKSWLERTADGKGSILMGSASALDRQGAGLADRSGRQAGGRRRGHQPGHRLHGAGPSRVAADQGRPAGQGNRRLRADADGDDPALPGPQSGADCGGDDRLLALGAGTVVLVAAQRGAACVAHGPLIGSPFKVLSRNRFWASDPFEESGSRARGKLSRRG